MPRKKGYWNEDRLQKVANRYKTKNEMRNKNPAAYDAAKRRRILGKIFINHDNGGNLYTKRGTWSCKENVIKEAKKYKTRTDFQYGSSGAYDKALDEGWVDDCFAGHPNKGFALDRSESGTWTIENLEAEASKFGTKREMRAANPAAYQAAKKAKAVDYIFRNHVNRGKTVNMNHRCLYVFEDEQTKEFYVGLTCDISRRYADHKKSSKFNGFKFKTLKFPEIYDKKIRTYKGVDIEYIPVVTAAKMEQFLIENYKKDEGFKSINKAKGGSIGSVNKIWTKDACQALADQCKNRAEFAKNGGALDAAYANKWMNELFKNHELFGYHTEARMLASFKKYGNPYN